MSNQVLSPLTATPGQALSVTFRVNVGAAAIPGAHVGYHIQPENEWSSENNIIYHQQVVNLNALTAYSYSFNPTVPANTAPGRYWLTTAVWDSNWDNVVWVSNLATLVVVPNTASISRTTALSPSSQFVGQSVTFSTTLSVKLGATGITGGHAGCYLAPAGWTQESQKIASNWANGISLAAGSTNTFTCSASVSASATAGNYILYAGVWDSNWENIVYASDLAVFSVKSNTPNMASFSTSANTVARGSSVVISMTVAGGSYALNNGNVGYGLVRTTEPDNEKSIVAAQASVSVAIGGSVVRSWTAVIPANAPTGQYRVYFGLWNSQWDNLDWTDNGIYVTVN